MEGHVVFVGVVRDRRSSPRCSLGASALERRDAVSTAARHATSSCANAAPRAAQADRLRIGTRSCRELPRFRLQLCEWVRRSGTSSKFCGSVLCAWQLSARSCARHRRCWARDHQTPRRRGDGRSSRTPTRSTARARRSEASRLRRLATCNATSSVVPAPRTSRRRRHRTIARAAYARRADADAAPTPIVFDARNSMSSPPKTAETTWSVENCTARGRRRPRATRSSLRSAAAAARRPSSSLGARRRRPPCAPNTSDFQAYDGTSACRRVCATSAASAHQRGAASAREAPRRRGASAREGAARRASPSRSAPRWSSLRAGSNFDWNCKEWRLFADVINDVGLTLDMLAPLAEPRHRRHARGRPRLVRQDDRAGRRRARRARSITAHFALVQPRRRLAKGRRAGTRSPSSASSPARRSRALGESEVRRARAIRRPAAAKQAGQLARRRRAHLLVAQHAGGVSREAALGRRARRSRRPHVRGARAARRPPLLALRGRPRRAPRRC